MIAGLQSADYQQMDDTLLLQGNAIELGHFAAQNIPVRWGQNNESSIYYDGTNLVANPKVSGSGILNVLSTIQGTGYQSSDGSAGLSTTITTTSLTGKTITVKNGLITGFA